MAEAEVGDDDYGEDPTVRALEESFAARVGKPAALFVASGVMANQIALRVLTTPGTAVVAGHRQHVVAYEYGAAAMNAGIQFIGVDDGDGMVDPADVRRARQAAEHHQPEVSLVSIENSHMAAAGALVDDPSAGAGRRRRAGPHPHGRGPTLQRRDRHRRTRGRVGLAATTVMCCLSKGLCAPVGSLLAGQEDVIPRPAWPASALAGACARPACWRRRDCSPCTTWSTACTRTTPGRHGWPRPWPALARCGRSRLGPHEPGRLHPRRPREAAGPPGDPRGVGPRHRPRVVRLVTHHDVDDEGIARAVRRLRPRGDEGPHRPVSPGRETGPDAMVALARRIAEAGFDSLWLPEVLTGPGPDPLVGLAWVRARTRA